MYCEASGTTVTGKDIKEYANHHCHDRALNQFKNLSFFRKHILPKNENGQADDSDQSRTRCDVIQRLENLGKGILSIYLKEGKIAFRILVISKKVRDLLQNNDDPPETQIEAFPRCRP